MLKWLLVGLVVFLVYRFAMKRPRYDRLFSPDHLIELSRGLGRAKDTALKRPGGGPPADPFAEGNAFITSAEIAVVYTVAEAGEAGREHHVSLSFRGGALARAAAGFLAAAIRRLLGLGEMPCVLAASKSGVYHLIFQVPAAEEARFAARSVPKLDDASAQRLVGVAMEDRGPLLARLGKLDVKLPK
ncbi:hypothetical protein predicted by Glimmer/Critica [Sorangium cellulosum So ce56]|uniref:Uncharacterized protein n=1 Tax=Sorangium cellulosum (strain So ce56) TaxID=448385 RepID=A9EWU2_SORC5|nr:hypothetical protein [Sorangium cellulosum]CAN94351.1 hypothetical protein predicted by Glimmer/Critica [Sorangium cellulosum So ce56]